MNFVGDFQKAWNEIYKTNFKVGTDDERIASVLEELTGDIEKFIRKILICNVQSRDDYHEKLFLCLIFLNKLPQEQVKFYKTGSIFRTR